MKKKIFIFLGFVIVLVVIFKYWLTPTLLAGGDMGTYSPSMAKDVSLLTSWNDRDSGMGNSKLIIFPLEVYLTTTMKFTQALDWRLYERIFWLFPILIFSITSSFFLVKKFVHKTSYALLGSFLYVLNTYVLMLIGGGQNGVALAYSVLPFLLLTYVNLVENPRFLESIVFTLSLNIVLFFDSRVMYISLVMLTILTISHFFYFYPKAQMSKRIIYLVLLPALLTIGLQAFWFLPLFASKGSAVNQLGKAYTGNDSVKYFSFASFENAIGLLQPNWPENIFGKVGFMRPEFLLLPFLAFSSLFFVQIKKNKESFYILLFALLGLIGIFLAKGANDPFGGLYLWLFNHVPGFILFRDPTKWYMIIAISYSILVPYSLKKIYNYLQVKFQKYNTKFTVSNLFLILVICGLLFTIRQALFGQLGGTFKPHVIPQEYKNLEKYIESQRTFSRSLWIPMVQRYGSFTNNHPAIPAQNYYNVASISGVLSSLNNKDALQQLQDSSIKYVIVPFDSEGEIFLNDRKYSKKLYTKTVKGIENIAWLKELPGFGKISVFEVPDSKDHFFLQGSGKLLYKSINPTKYEVYVTNVTKGEKLVFSESYDKYWLATSKGQGITSTQFDGLLNSFVLPMSGTYKITVEYTPQKYVIVGIVLSGITALAICFAFISYFVYEKNYRKYTK